jgi:hypothetical protein
MHLLSSTANSGAATSSSSSSTPPLCELPLPTERNLHPALPPGNDTNGTVANSNMTSSRRGKRHRKSLETLARRRRPAAANAATMSWEDTNTTTTTITTTTERFLEPGRPLALDQVVVPSALARYEPPTTTMCVFVCVRHCRPHSCVTFLTFFRAEFLVARAMHSTILGPRCGQISHCKQNCPSSLSALFGGAYQCRLWSLDGSRFPFARRPAHCQSSVLARTTSVKEHCRGERSVPFGWSSSSWGTAIPSRPGPSSGHAAGSPHCGERIWKGARGSRADQ